MRSKTVLEWTGPGWSIADSRGAHEQAADNSDDEGQRMTMTDGCDMMWYDMMWCDMIWCDMIWYDVIWCDMISCDVTTRWTQYMWIHDTTSHHMIWHDTTSHHMIWHEVTGGVWSVERTHHREPLSSSALVCSTHTHTQSGQSYRVRSMVYWCQEVTVNQASRVMSRVSEWVSEWVRTQVALHLDRGRGARTRTGVTQRHKQTERGTETETETETVLTPVSKQGSEWVNERVSVSESEIWLLWKNRLNSARRLVFSC
jgi:hypothetical protein